MGAIALILLVGYLAAGLATGLAFVAYGITRVQPAPVTFGARLLLLPGSVALWPFILVRWLKVRSAP
jgi:hypothetical protein